MNLCPFCTPVRLHLRPLLLHVLAPAPVLYTCHPPHSPFHSTHLHLYLFHTPTTHTYSTCLQPAPIPHACHPPPFCTPATCTHSAHLPSTPILHTCHPPPFHTPATHTHSTHLPPAPVRTPATHSAHLHLHPQPLNTTKHILRLQYIFKLWLFHFSCGLPHFSLSYGGLPHLLLWAPSLFLWAAPLSLFLWWATPPTVYTAVGYLP
jgi:hypothetical protein